MMILLVAASLLLLVVANALLFILIRRTATVDISPLVGKLDALDQELGRGQREAKDDLERLRQSSGEQGRGLREELQASLRSSSEQLVNSLTQSRTELQQHFESFGRRLTDLNQAALDNAAVARAEQERQSKGLRESVETKLTQLQTENGTKLEEMRQTVDEKLHGTLEKRLGESFKIVSERLELVHKGLGEMQALANGVGDLKRVLTNVKTRGIWAEVQLGNLLDQILTPQQFERNVKTKPGGREHVEFALKLPGPDGLGGKPVYMPIDSKFPKEDYERLVDAAERGAADEVEQASKSLEVRVRAQSRDIRDKYLAPPNTTDFGLLYVPTEGLYAEILRRPGLVDDLQRECRVLVVGPTTLAALLNSLQMGFRTLAIQKSSSEVWKVLGAVKTEFGKFGAVLEKVKAKLDETSSTIEDAAHRSRQIEKSLKKVEALPQAEATALLADDDSPESNGVETP